MLIILTSCILCFTNPFKYLFYRKVPVILPIPWEDVVSHFNDTGWELKNTPGDGFCFISSIVQCMESDHNIVLDKSKVQDLIIDQGIENSEQYSNYHFNRMLTKKETLHNTDSFMCKLINFFESRDFTWDVVDLIIQIAADALGLNIYIYQGNTIQNPENGIEESHTEVLKHSGGLLCKDVYLKFTHDNIHPQGNHYEPLLKSEERQQSEQIHKDFIEIFGEDTEELDPHHSSFLNEHEEEVIYLQDDVACQEELVISPQSLVDEPGVTSVEDNEEVVISPQSLIDEPGVTSVEDNEEVVISPQNLVDERSVTSVEDNEEVIISPQSLIDEPGVTSDEDNEELVISPQSLVDEPEPGVTSVEDNEEVISGEIVLEKHKEVQQQEPVQPDMNLIHEVHSYSYMCNSDEPSVCSNISTPVKLEYNSNANWDGPLDLHINTSTGPVQETQNIAICTDNKYTDEIDLPDIRHGRSFPTWMFKEADAEVVQRMPDLPNGKKLYKIYTGKEEWHEITSDLRFFDLKTSSWAQFCGVRKVGKCLGSWVCPNNKCAFQATLHEHQPNHINWKGVRGRKDIKICQICEAVGVREGCGARKLVEFNPTTRIAYVLPLGNTQMPR